MVLVIIDGKEVSPKFGENIKKLSVDMKNVKCWGQWEYIGYESAKKIDKECTCVCTKKLKHKYYLKNKYNGKYIRVGESCLKKFHDTNYKNNNNNLEKFMTLKVNGLGFGEIYDIFEWSNRIKNVFNEIHKQTGKIIKIQYYWRKHNKEKRKRMEQEQERERQELEKKRQEQEKERQNKIRKEKYKKRLYIKTKKNIKNINGIYKDSGETYINEYEHDFRYCIKNLSKYNYIGDSNTLYKYIEIGENVYEKSFYNREEIEEMVNNSIDIIEKTRKKQEQERERQKQEREERERENQERERQNQERERQKQEREEIERQEKNKQNRIKKKEAAKSLERQMNKHGKNRQRTIFECCDNIKK